MRGKIMEKYKRLVGKMGNNIKYYQQVESTEGVVEWWKID